MKSILVLLSLVLALSTVVQAQEDMMSGIFTPASETAVVKHASTEWEKGFAYTDPGAVTFYDGQFHMFRNAFEGWPASVAVDYMTSPDAITWTEEADAPVLKTEDVPFAKVAALASSVVVAEDGTWMLYFYTWNANGIKGLSQIGLATASDPHGPWTVHPEPVLKADADGNWDEGAVNMPQVLHTENGYVMYFAGYDESGNRSGQIGMATSEDGITWTKYNDPTTTDARFAESDPILSATEEWEGIFVNQPRVVSTPDGWAMFYRASGANPAIEMTIGLATSTDGVSWTKYTEKPVFSPADAGQTAMWFTAAVSRDDTYYLFTELAPDGNSAITEIFTNTYTGSLPPI